MNYQLKINDKKINFDSFNDAKEEALSQVKNHFESEKQSYYGGMPFSVGSFFSGLFDEGIITDEEIVMFQRIEMLLSDICCYEFLDRPTEYIKKNYEYHKSTEDTACDFFIIKEDDEIRLELDCDEDYLYTNMFNMTEGNDYYFRSRQMVVIEQKGDKRKLGEIIEFELFLKKDK